MNYPGILLWISAALFLVFGLGFIAAPAWLADLVTGAEPQTSSAIIDMRATYGGMALGIGAFFAACALHPKTVRLGLVAAIMVLAGVAAGRIIGLVVAGGGNTFMYLLLGAEVLFVVLIGVALRWGRSS